MSGHTNNDTQSQAADVKPEILYYPLRLESELDKGTSMLKFTIIERRDRSKITHIYTPAPNQFTISDSASYDTLEKNDIAMAFGGGLSLAREGVNALMGNETRFNSGGAQSAESFSADLAVTGLLFGGGIPYIGGQMNEIAFAAGAAVNKGERTRFVSNAVRNYSFMIEFSPESSKENKEIIEIIETFRRYTYASRGQNVLSLNYPPEILCEFFNGDKRNPNFPTLAPSFLESVQSNYNPNTFALHSDGGAETYTLNLAFKETKKLIREEIDELRNAKESDSRHKELYKNNYMTAEQIENAVDIVKASNDAANEEFKKAFLDEQGIGY